MTMQYILIILALLLSLVCGLISMPLIIRYCISHHLYDLPNERKIHHNKIPRLGGICFLPSMLLATIAIIFLNREEATVTFSLWSVNFFISLAIIYLTGLVDDLTGLNATTKLIMQIIAASFMPMSGLWINNLYGFFGIYAIPFFVGAPLTVFIMVFIDNAMNLIDGIDGLCAGLSILSLGGFLYCFLREGLLLYCLLIAGLIGVLIAFMKFNLFSDPSRKQKIFMGDSGSLSVGFILGFLLVKFTMDNPGVMPFRRDSLMLSSTMLIVPIFDVIRVSLDRLFHKRPIFDADKNHIHHKLIRAGFTQHQTLIIILSLSLSLMVMNIILYHIFYFSITFVIDVILWMIFHITINMKIKARGEHPFVVCENLCKKKEGYSC